MLGNCSDNQPRKGDSHVGRVERFQEAEEANAVGTRAITGADREGRRWARHPVSMMMDDVSSQGQMESSH